MKFAVPIHHRQRADVVVTHASDFFRQGTFWGDGGRPECHDVARFHALGPSAFKSSSSLKSCTLPISLVSVPLLVRFTPAGDGPFHDTVFPASRALGN